MRRHRASKVVAFVASLAATSATFAQESSRVFPWSQREGRPSASRDKNVRSASLVETLDHKQKILEASYDGKKSLPSVLVDEPALPSLEQPLPTAPVAPTGQAVPGVNVIDPTLAPPAPQGQTTSPIMPIPTSTTHKTVTGPMAPAPRIIPIPGPVTIQGPNDGLPPNMAIPPGVPVIQEGMVGGEMVHEGMIVGPAPPGEGGIFPDGSVVEGVNAETHAVPPLAAMLPGCYGEIGVCYLQYLRGRDEIIARTRFDGTSFFERSSNDFSTNFQPGVRVLFGCPIGCGTYVESSFMGMNNWNRTLFLDRGLITDSFTAFPTLAGNATGFNRQEMTLDGWFSSGEVNTKWAISVFPTSYIIFGIRNFSLSEKLTVREFGQITGPRGPVDAVATMEVDAFNAIIGPQVGFETRWNNWGGRFSFDSYVKAGLGWNLERVTLTRTLSNSTVGATASAFRDRDTDCTGWLEVMTAATFQVTPGVAIRGGWQFIALYGYASGPLQHPWAFFQSDQRFDLDSSERGYFQGPFASLEFTWGGIR